MIIMNNSRTHNSLRNIFYGLINKIVVLLLPFITRTMLLYLLGTKSVGISTLFSSILVFLSLAELGFGSAVVYTMYKPISNGDYTMLNALLNYYRSLYRCIGIAVLIIGLILTPFLPYLIKGETPDGVNLYLLFFLYLINSVISYFFAGYRQSLLVAHQRSDIRDKIAMSVTIAVRIGEVLAIYFTRSLYVFVLCMVLGTLTTNIVTAIVTRKMYPDLYCKGEVSKEIKQGINKRLGGLFGTKLNSIVVHQADTLIISAFLGLTFLAQYGNYYFIISAISGFVMTFFASMTASIGNKIAVDSGEEVFKLFKKINFINNWIVGWSSICLLCLMHPFMIIWVKEDLTLPITMSVLMTLYFYIYQIQRTILTFKDAGGLWYEDRYRPYTSMVINVILNLILVQYIGIYGVVTSTILAFFISIPWCNYIVFKYMFQKSAIRNLLMMIANLIITSVIGLFTYFVCQIFPVSILGLIERLFFCIFASNIFYILLFRKTDEYRFFKNLLNKMLLRKLT